MEGPDAQSFFVGAWLGLFLILGCLHTGYMFKKAACTGEQNENCKCYNVSQLFLPAMGLMGAGLLCGWIVPKMLDGSSN